MVEVELVTVRVEMPANTSVVLLRERGGQRRLLPILIGSSEARPSPTPSTTSRRPGR